MKNIFLSLLMFLISISTFAQKIGGMTVKKKQDNSIYNSLKLNKTAIKKKPIKKNYISIEYQEPYDTAHTVWYESFKEEKYLETMASVLNSTFKINTPLKLSLKECGTPNAFYNSEKKELILCYEFLEFLRKMYENKYATPEEWGTKVGYVLSFIYFHEVGHTLIDLYDLPITGKEEDAADYFSFYLLGSNQVPEGELACVEGASFFADLSVYRDSINTILVKEGKPANALPFWDEHSFDMQRFYNIFSLMYGSNPKKNAYLLDLKLLGERRPEIAISEYKKIKNGWNKILKDYIKWHK